MDYTDYKEQEKFPSLQLLVKKNRNIACTIIRYEKKFFNHTSKFCFLSLLFLFYLKHETVYSIIRITHLHDLKRVP